MLPQLVASAAAQFEQRFKRPPQWIVAAPGRVNLIGEHVDYNDGFVLPMAIDRYCIIAAAPLPVPVRDRERDGDSIGNDETRMTNDENQRHSSFDIPSSLTATFYSTAANEEAIVSLAEPQKHPTPGHWSNYVAGVMAGCNARGMRPAAFQAVIESSVPYGGGLSSSASLEVAAATLVEAMIGQALGPIDKVLLCQQAEHEYAGVPCGIMDQFASVLGQADHLTLLDCRAREIEQIPFADPNITVLIINTNVKHKLAGGEYAVRRSQCESAARKLRVPALRDATLAGLDLGRDRLDANEFRRARHVISEIARTKAAAAAVKAHDWPRVGQLMYASHDSLHNDFEVSCRELDLLVNLARELGPAAGVIGSRMTGGGFGGCTVSLVETTKVDAVAQHLTQTYRAATGIVPTLLTSRPARGAHIVQVLNGALYDGRK